MKSATPNLLKLLLCLAMILTLFTGCAQEGSEDPTIPRYGFIRKRAEYIVQAVTAEDFPLLEECVSLQYLDLSGSTCYDLILDYIQRHPEVEVIYHAPLGSMPILFNYETEATLAPDSYTADSLLEQLKYLPNLKNLYLPTTELSHNELDGLREFFPYLNIEFSRRIFGKEYTGQETNLDLTAMNAVTAEEIMDALSWLPQMQEVSLPLHLTMEEVKALMDQYPAVTFHYTFDLFGQTLNTATESVEFVKKKIGNEGEAAIRAALDIMPKCSYFKLENCGLDNEVLASIRDSYPNTKLVWRVSFGGQYSLLTDETTLRTVYGVKNSHNDILKYCTGLKYIDMGHNPDLTDISFASYMPDLEILILSGSSVKNVDPLANCKNLVFLELANCGALEDISALKNCENLRFLNIGFSQVTDLTPIQDLPLERFICLGPKMDEETQKAFEESHPDCWVRFTGKNPLSLGWKYDDIGETYSEYYKFIREVFDLDAVDRRLAQQAAREEAAREEAAQSKPSEGSSAETPAPAPAPEPAPET